jgi:diguanylate cyclase (GGDEF)-like protein
MKLIKDSKGMPFEIIGYILEITERKGLEERLIQDALHDPLTGLPNRLVLMDKLTHYLALDQEKSGNVFSLLFMDLDRFKKVNDSLGHDIGDKLLVLVAKRLRNCIYASDIVVRLGGDEFSVILKDIKSIDGIVAIAERILNDLSNPFYVENQEIFVTGSIGITINNMDYDRPEQLLRDADLAMYNAKAKGGGCYALFDTVMHEKAINMMQIETDLQHAIEREQLFLLYQPIISGTTGMVEGFEALLRWDHPQRGVINPMDFILIAEDTGLIIPIGNWVLITACHQMCIWQKKFPLFNKLSISVNVSSKQFTEELLQQINTVLLETGIDPSCFILEITESVIMDNPDLTANIIMNLKDIHVRLQIDDFGTGYSSLSYLHHFPVDALKIDRSFVRRMNDNNDKLEIVKLIVDMAHNLKMNVVAEGVETIEQYDKLRSLECEYLQGFFFSKPISAEDIEIFLRQNHNFSTHLISQ